MVSIKIPKYNEQGKKSGEEEIKTQYQDLRFAPDLIHQMVTGYLANSRQVLAHTKTRGEVRGGGKKPWRQKGTGRARIGSSRAPHWIGGGVVFGPRKNRNFKKTLPKKMRRKALALVLAKKNEEKELLAIEAPKMTAIKTKQALLWLKNLPLKEGNILLLLAKANPILYLSTRNLPYLQNKKAGDLNCLDLLQFDNILMGDGVCQEISKILSGAKTDEAPKQTPRVPEEDIKATKSKKLARPKKTAKDPDKNKKLTKNNKNV